MKLTLKIWRQENAAATGAIHTYELDGVSKDMSFLEMLDLLNEPDARGIKWSNGPKGPTVGMATYYEQAMDAIYKVSELEIRER